MSPNFIISPIFPAQMGREALRKTMARYLIKAEMEGKLNMEMATPTKHNSLNYWLSQHTKGSGQIYQKLLTEMIKDPTAPAYFTWRRDYSHRLTEKEWMKGLSSITRIQGLPKVKTISYEIFNRVYWTRQKEEWSGRGPGTCNLCGEEAQNTYHLFVACRVACIVWDVIKKLVREVVGRYIILDYQIILFHHISQRVRPDQRNFIINLLATGKYILHRLKQVSPCMPLHVKFIQKVTQNHLEVAALATNSNPIDIGNWKTAMEYLRYNIREN